MLLIAVPPEIVAALKDFIRRTEAFHDSRFALSQCGTFVCPAGAIFAYQIAPARAHEKDDEADRYEFNDSDDGDAYFDRPFSASKRAITATPMSRYTSSVSAISSRAALSWALCV